MWPSFPDTCLGACLAPCRVGIFQPKREAIVKEEKRLRRMGGQSVLAGIDFEC
jgi:hypothetical protein